MKINEAIDVLKEFIEVYENYIKCGGNTKDYEHVHQEAGITGNRSNVYHA